MITHFFTEFTNLTDRRTDRRTPHDGIGRTCIASRGNKLGTASRFSTKRYYRAYTSPSFLFFFRTLSETTAKPIIAKPEHKMYA